MISDMAQQNPPPRYFCALTCLGIDPTSTEVGFGTPDFNMITNLMKYQKDDGGFSHNMNDGKSQEMSTVQVLQALDAFPAAKIQVTGL